MRQIQLNDPNPERRYLYFDVVMRDGVTPAYDQEGEQPEITMHNTGWSSVNISTLQTVGFGRYRALLDTTAVGSLGVIKSRYLGTNTLESFGESVEIVEQYRNIDIFEDAYSPIIQSYCGIPEADNYFSMKYKNKVWVDASVMDKQKVLVQATQDIDNLAFSGVKTSTYITARREFYIQGDADDIWLGLSWVRQINGFDCINLYNKYCPGFVPNAPGIDLDPGLNNPGCIERRFNVSGDSDSGFTDGIFWTIDNNGNKVYHYRQSLEFPRNGSNRIPKEIKMATCEIAYQLLNGFDIELETQSFSVIHQSFANVRDSFDRRFVAEHIRAGIASIKAWQYLKPFLRSPKYFRLARV